REARGARGHARLSGGHEAGAVPTEGIVRRGPRRAPAADGPPGRVRDPRAADPPWPADLHGPLSALRRVPASKDVPLRPRAIARGMSPGGPWRSQVHLPYSGLDFFRSDLETEE